MNITPWRRRSGAATTDLGLESLWPSVWDPFEMRLERLPEALRGRAAPPMDVAESEEALDVSVELPGLDAEDVNVDLMGHQLTVSGERKWEDEKKDKEFHRIESQYGSFSRTVTLPETLHFDPARIEAHFERGVLHVRIPKLEPTPSSRIRVKPDHERRKKTKES